MKYLSLIFALFLAVLPLNGMAHVNNYFFDQDSGYFDLRGLDNKNKDFEGAIYFVDFKNEKIKKVLTVGKSIHSITLSPDRKYLASSGHYMSEGFFVYSLTDEKSVFHLPGFTRMPYWSSNSRWVIVDRTVYDVVQNKSYEVTDAKYIIHYGWRDSCQCFLFEKPGPEAPTMGGELLSEKSPLWSFDVENGARLYKGNAHQFQGPDGLYMTSIPSLDTEPGAAILHGLKGEVSEIEFDTWDAARETSRPLWGKDVFRIYEKPYSTFNYVKGGFLSGYGLEDFYLSHDSTLYRRSTAEEQQRVSARPSLRDMGVGEERYVLMWNRDEKLFMVEDIDTGGIVKTYKKFW